MSSSSSYVSHKLRREMNEVQNFKLGDAIVAETVTDGFDIDLF